MKDKRRLFVTGIGAVTPLGVGVDALDSGLREGRSGVTLRERGESVPPVWAPLPQIDVEAHAQRLGLSDSICRTLKRIAHRSHEGMRSALLSAVEAWNRSGLTSRMESERIKVGLVVAGSNLANAEVLESGERLRSKRRVRPSYAAQFLDSDYVGCISELLGLRAEGYTAGAASASGGVAIALGRRAVLSGDVDAVLVVGAPTLLSEVELSALGSIGALRLGEAPARVSEASRPFDREAKGFVYGQGAAALLLESEECVKRSPDKGALAVLCSATMGLDANHATDPSVQGEVLVMSRALDQADVRSDQIDLVSTHGTSSALGDRTELAALQEVFSKTGARPLVNASKALTGHCLSAAGVVEAVVAVLQLCGKYFHPNPHLDEPIDRSLDWVEGTVRIAQPRSILSNSFGFGGINSSQVFARP